MAGYIIMHSAYLLAQLRVPAVLTINQRDVDGFLLDPDLPPIFTLICRADIQDVVVIMRPQGAGLVWGRDPLVGEPSVKNLSSEVCILVPREDHVGILTTLPVHEAAAAKHSDAAYDTTNG